MRSQSPLPADSKDWSDRKYRVVFRYCPRHDDELSINEGDIITVLHEVEEGWWKGVLNGQVGMFPSNFVEEIVEPSPFAKKNELNGNGINTSIKDHSRNNDSPHSRNSNSPDGHRSPKIVGSPNSAFHPIQPKREERESKRNSIGDTTSASKVEKSHVSKGSKVNSNSAEPDRQSYEKDKITISIGEDVHRRDKEPLTRVPSTTLEPTPPLLPPKPVRELARVVFPYSADHDDELELFEGDIITVLCKELEDKGWWKGEINSKVGVFPDNFVELINADEAMKPPRPEKRPTALPKPKLTSEAHTTQKKATAPSPVSHAPKKPHASSHAKKRIESLSDTVAHDQPACTVDGSECLALDREHHLIHQTQTRPKGPSNRRPPSQTFLDDKKTSLSEDEELSSLAEEIVTPIRETPATNSTSSEVPWMKELKANQKKKKLSGTPSLEPSQNNSTSTVDGSPADVVTRRCRSESTPPTKARTSTGSSMSVKVDVSSPAPARTPVATNGFKDDPPVTQPDYDSLVAKLRAEFTPQIKKLEERLVEQQQRHNRQLLMFMDELGEERQKIACLQIDIDRLTKLTSSDANV